MPIVHADKSHIGLEKSVGQETRFQAFWQNGVVEGPPPKSGPRERERKSGERWVEGTREI